MSSYGVQLQTELHFAHNLSGLAHSPFNDSEYSKLTLNSLDAEDSEGWIIVGPFIDSPSTPGQEVTAIHQPSTGIGHTPPQDLAHATMVFLGIYRAVYDYEPRSNNELAITEGDLLFVLEKSTEDDWWKAKKKAINEDDEEPEGLIPNNYVEEAVPISKARALYDYARQTDEELSFAEESVLDVYDTSDPDWTLVGQHGEYGFAPANYIEASGASAAEPAPPAMPARHRQSGSDSAAAAEPLTPNSIDTPTQSPALALAGILAQRTGPNSASTTREPISPPPATLPPRQQQFTPEESDDDVPPPMPRRPPSEQISPRPTQVAFQRPPSPGGVQPSPPYDRSIGPTYDEDADLRSPGGFHMYSIHEMIEHNGRNRKMPVTLGVNVAKGMIMIAPEKSRDGPQKEWTAEKLTHYSLEGKHVFMELVRPSRSIDFHAGAKDTAQEIVSALSEIAGASKAEGLREIIAAGQGGPSQKSGKMLYEFMAQGDDEVTVAAGDDIIVLDDKKSDEWWMVRRLKNGKEGVVPSSYVEITGLISVTSPTTSGINAGKSTVEQNRLEEERMTKQAAKSSRREDDAKGAEVGSGIHLPQRMSSLLSGGTERRSSQRGKRDSRAASGQSSSGKTKPNLSKVRTWTDRSGTFKVEAEFIGLREGKIHLHKLNGIKIAVPVPKMSVEDLEYVERESGVSLDDDKPLSSIKRSSTQRQGSRTTSGTSTPKAGISVEQPNKAPEYDWFDFFLQCGVNPQICERYAAAFHKDQMGEENQQDITPSLLRTLGLKEGDILRVTKFLDNKFGRQRNADGITNGDGPNGSLFAGAGGALKNNTKKGRPTPAVETNDTIDANAFSTKENGTSTPTDAVPTPIVAAPTAPPKPERRISTGFEDNAWEPRQVKQQQTASSVASTTPAKAPTPASAAPTPAPVQPPTGGLADLNLLSQPLQPTPAPQPAPVSAQQTASTTGAPQQSAQQLSQPTGATPSLFEQLAHQAPGQPPQQPQQQFALPRQRPLAPQLTGGGSGLVAPPPPRAASVPASQSFASPPALQPQLTGYHNQPQIHTQISPSGQSLQDINQQRLQQNFMQAQPTGYGGYGQSALSQQPFMNGQQMNSPFADPTARPFQPMQTGFPGGFQQGQLQPQQTGVNAFLPPALQPQKTGFNQFSNIPNMQQQQAPPMPNQFTNGIQPQQTGFGNFQPLQPQQTGFGQPQFQQQAPPIPPIPQQAPTPAPLVPQKTGPAPPVRFGVAPAANKLMPQPTGRRANLSQATPQNPFGF